MSLFPRDAELCQLFRVGKTLVERWKERRRGSRRDERRSDLAFLFPMIHQRARLCVAAVCSETAAADSLGLSP